MGGVKLDTQSAPNCFLGVDAALTGMQRAVIQRCSTIRMKQAGGAKNRENSRGRAPLRLDGITYHTPYRRRRRPFDAGASPLCDACAAACKVEENEGNCQ